MSIQRGPTMGFFTPEEPCQMVPAAILKRIPKTKYPIRVMKVHRSRCRRESSEVRIFRWRRCECEYEWRAVWLVEPNIQHLKEAVMPYLEDIFPESQELQVNYLTRGFNKIFTATTLSPQTLTTNIESDVATMELVRCSISIPVPTLYASGSSGSNKLRLERMLMEEVGGRELRKVWFDWDYDAKLRVSETVALWISQRLQITSDNIESVYMRSAGEEEEFYVGRSVHYSFLATAVYAFSIRGKMDHLEGVLQEGPRSVDNCNGLPSPRPASSMDQESEDPYHPLETAEGALYEQADRDDAEYYNWQELTAEHLQQRIRRMAALKQALPKLYRRAAKKMPRSSTGNTSNSDHEPAREPCPNPWKGTIQEDVPVDPDGEERRWESLLARGWIQEEQKTHFSHRYSEESDEYHCTILRRECKQQLNQLMPNLSPSAWPDDPSSLRESNNYSDGPEAKSWPHWAKQCIDDEELGEEDEDEEPGRETKPRICERRTKKGTSSRETRRRFRRCIRHLKKPRVVTDTPYAHHHRTQPSRTSSIRARIQTPLALELWISDNPLHA